MLVPWRLVQTSSAAEIFPCLSSTFLAGVGSLKKSPTNQLPSPKSYVWLVSGTVTHPKKKVAQHKEKTSSP